MEIIRDGIKYYYNHIGAYVCADSYKGNIIIPAYIQDNANQTIPVVGIEARAFYKAEITSISLPEGLQEIGIYSFAMCNQLTEIRIPSTVKSIGEHAFCCCEQLVHLVLPEGLLHIPKGCFAACFKLDNINLPSTIKSVDEYAFNATAWFNRQQGGVAYVGDVLYGYSWQKFESSVLQIKDGTRVINNNAFAGSKTLTKVILPASVKVIGNSAFEECKLLKSIHLPEGLRAIGENAFAECSALESIHIPSTVKHICAGAFAKCSGLREIVVDEKNPHYDSRGNCNAIIKTHSNRLVVGCANTVIPEDIIMIGDMAFKGIWTKEDLIIPQSVRCIGGEAFFESNTLRHVVLHDQIEMIGNHAFAYCTALTDLVLPTHYIDIGEDAFFDTPSLEYQPSGIACINNHLHTYSTPIENTNPVPDCVIPEGIEYIDDMVFHFAPSGLRIFLPKSLKRVSCLSFIPSEREYEVIVPEGVGENYPFNDDGSAKDVENITDKWYNLLNEDWGWDEEDSSIE